ncbi:S1 family peptidase [Leucobacter allii]|uniref:S1 family peptidase n=1 Tax=Leucobacter allii TaxID=2932247 RepID=A0ABY4FIU4_9MICO|nr:trypsin-like serine protease [Leucobacter allii]UOQ56604.1 S1 family peptidase [Leucobacter allii]
MTKRRPLALGAAAALGLGSLFIAAPAMAEDTAAPEASTTQDPTALASAAAADIQQEKGDDSVVGYGATTNGEAVVLVNAALQSDAAAIDAIAAENGVEKVALVGAAVADAATDVVGGAGYIGDVGDGYVGACSIGFTGFNGSGDPALITAGHCSSDGAMTELGLSKPSTEPAVGGEGYESNGTGIAGVFGFSQFGGPGNTNGAENDPTSTDIAVIDITNDDLTLHPEVTDWTSASSDDLAASTTPIKGVSDPVSGSVSKSGRTSGVTEGSTELELLYTDGNTYPTEILDGYMQISGKWVHGFLGGALTDHGDSGGSVFQGDQAVGVVSGGPEEAPPQGDDWAWYTRLADALEQVPGGYSVAIDIDAPVVQSPSNGATVEPGDDIVVSVADNATDLNVQTGPSSGETVPADGEVTLQAPEAEGTYTWDLVATNGYSASDATEFTFTVDETIAKPTVGAQSVAAAEGETEATIDLTGTGLAGATVTVNDIWTAEVGDDGTWSIADVSFGIGENVVTAVQELEGETSPEANGTITVAPAAPKITSIEPGQTFANAEAPSELSGTGLAGAETSLTINGAAASGSEAAVVAQAEVGDDGAWTESLGALGAGTYSVEVVQAYNGVSSAAAQLVFTVEAASTTPTDPTDPTTPTTPSDPTNPSNPANPGGPGSQLPVTGGIDLLPYTLTALGMLVLGGGAIAFAARRLKASEV